MYEQTVELIRNGKYHMKIGNRKQVPLPVFNPGFPLGILAFGTMTVTATVLRDTDMPARIATIFMPSQFRCTAMLNSP
jgi:hypothetical protein